MEQLKRVGSPYKRRTTLAAFGPKDLERHPGQLEERKPYAKNRVLTQLDL